MLKLAPGAVATSRGWVKTRRDSKGVHFIQLNDGSCFQDLQIVMDAGSAPADVMAKVTTGACVRVEGEMVESPGKGQSVELRGKSIEVLGAAPPESYPLQKKKHTLETLREFGHFRTRANTFGAVFRVRNALAFAAHKFFQERGFLYVHSPILTTSDAEGAGAVRFVQITEMRGDWNPQTWRYPDATCKQTSWRLLRKTAGSTELEFSIHSLAHVCMLLKSPMSRVSATGGVTFYKDRDTRDLSSLWCEFSNGARLSYSFSCYAPGGGGAIFSILGDKGTLRRERGQLVYQGHGGKPETLSPANVSDDRAETALYRDLFRDIREKRPSALGPEFAMEPMKIAFACELSIAEGRVVTARDFA